MKGAQMSNRTPLPSQAYAPDGNRASQKGIPRSAESLLHWIAFLMFFLHRPLKAFRLVCSGRAGPARRHARPDLPAGSAQAYFASVRGAFGTSIRWMCIRHGIGPGHKDWPEVSLAIVAYGGSLDGLRAGALPKGLEWWENPGLIPGVVLVPGFSAFAPAAVLTVEQRVVADAAAAAPTVVQAEAARSVQAEAAQVRLPASWLAASRQHVFARAGPGLSTGPPFGPGLHKSNMSDARGRSMASPAVLIRAG